MAKDYFQSKEFKDLLKSYEEQLEQGKSIYMDADDFADVADYYISMDKPLMAMDALGKGLSLHPDDEVLMIVLSATYIYQQKYDEAENVLNNLDASNSDVKYQLAQLQYAKYHNMKNVAVYGCTSYDFIAGGTGSGNVNRAYTVSLLDGLKNAGFKVDESKKKAYLKHIADEAEAFRASLDKNDMLAAFYPAPRPSELIPNMVELAASALKNDVAIITFGRNSGEFFDRTSADFSLNEGEKKLLQNVTKTFHALGKKVVVVLNVGGVVETASWKDIPDAILLAWQAGQEGGNSVTDILTGVESPSGKLPMTFPVNLMDAASSANFPIDATNEVYFMSRREDVGQKDVDVTRYEEGIYVGYRWFDKQNLPVSYPFGYGLSYTSFEYSQPSVKNDGKTITATVNVKNVGEVAGKEAVQLYVSAPAGSLDKPVKELKAYGKTARLLPGESQEITLSFPTSELASFDEEKSAWVVDEGTYVFQFGASSRDIRCCVEAEAAAAETPAHRVLLMQ